MGSSLVATSRWQAAALFGLAMCLCGTVARELSKSESSTRQPIPAMTLEGEPSDGIAIGLLQYLAPAEYECSDGGCVTPPASDHSSVRHSSNQRTFRVPASSIVLVAGQEPDPAAPVEEGDAPALPMPPEEEKPTEKKIVFSFSKTPWDVALTRFAELAELQLILNFKPPGTFDYSSTKAYTIPEALDVLNEVLLAEGFVVLRNDRFLTLAALDKPLPLNQVPTVGEDQLAERGRNEFVTVIKRLKFADPATIEPEVKKLLGQYGELQAVPKLKLLRLTDQVSKLAESLPLIDELDNSFKPAQNPPPQQPAPMVRRTYPLMHLTPERAQTLIKSILGISGTMELGPDGKSLIAVLTEAQHNSVKEFLAEIDIPSSKDDQPAEKTFTLHHAAAAGVGELLTSLYPPKETKVSVAAEPTANVVAVKGPGRLIEQIAKLVESLENQAEANAPVQQLYRTPGDATAILAQLKLAFNSRENPRISFTVDPNGQGILASAPPEIQSRIKEAIEKLGGIGDDTSSEQTTVVKLEHASAEKLATTLTTVFPKATTGASFGSEQNTNAIVVRAPAKSIESISKIIKDLDLPPAVMGLRDKQEVIYQPKHAKTTELIKLAEALYPTTTNVVFVPTGGNSKIVISAPPVLMEKVKSTLDMLDNASLTEPATTERTYSLRHAKPAEIIATLTSIFPPEKYEVKFIPDQRNNRIFVIAADPKIHDRISAMLNELDMPGSESESVEIYAAQNVPASQLIESLTKVFGTDATKPTFQIQPDGKSVLIRATRELQKRISELLAKIDVMGDEPGANPVDELYKLKFAKAAELVTALQKLYPPERTNVRISAEPANNILIITAPNDVHDRLKALIEKIDVPSDAKMQLQIYTPAETSPATIAGVIPQLSYEGVGPVTVSPDGRALFVIATKTGHERVKGLIDLVSTRDPNAAIVRKTYPVVNVPGTTLASMLQTLFPATGATGATIVADPSGKQLIIQAPERVQKAIAEVLKQTDVPSTLAQFTIAAKNVPVVSLYTALSQLFSGLDGTRITYDVGTNAVIVAATPTMKERIVALAMEFDQPIEAESGRKREMYRVTNVPASSVYSALVTLFPAAETGATFNYEPSNQVVIVMAPAGMQEKIKEEIKRIDVNPRADWATKAFRPKNVSATDLYTFLTTQLAAITNKTISMGPRSEEVIVNAPVDVIKEVDRLFEVFDVAAPADEDLVRKIYRPIFANPTYLALNLQAAFPKTRRVEVTSDPYSMTVTVIAPTAVQEEIAKVVAELDQSPRQGWVEETFEATNLTADQLLQLLTTALANETNKTLTASPNSRQLVVLAPPPVVERIRGLIKTLDVAPQPGGESVAKPYIIKYAAVGSIYQLLYLLYPPTTSGVKFYYDPTNNTITAYANPAVQEQIAKIVASMDIDPNANRIQKVFVPKHTPAQQLVTLLQTALATERNTSISLGPQKQSIVVFAPAESMERIEKYIMTLDTPQAVETSRQLYKLQFGNASYLVSTLQALYPPTQYPVIVTADAANNVLVVEAPPTIQEKIAGLVRELDVQQGGRMQTVYRLEHTRASSVLTSLQNLVSGTGATVVAGPDDKSIIANALPQQQEQVKNFIRDFDTTSNAQDPETKTYTLRYATASSVARMIGQIYSSDPKVRVTYDDARGTLLVTAPPESLKKIETLVSDADQEGIDSQLVGQVIRLQEASANDVARALTAAFPDRQKAIFVPDSNAGTIFVRALPRMMDEVRQMVQQLDQPAQEREREVAIFDLYKVDPFDASSIVRQLFEGVRGNDQPRVDTTFNPPRLVVRATQHQMKQIRDVLTRLEGSGSIESETPNGEPTGVRLSERPVERVIRLNNADPISTAQSIAESWPLLRRNKLNIVYRQSPLGLPKEKTIEQTPPAQETPKQEKAAESLPGEPDVPVNIIVGNDRLTATSRDIDALDLLQSLAEAWTEPFDPDTSASRVFYIEHGNVAEIAEAIDEAFNGKRQQGGAGERRRFRPERVRVVAEPSANALIVRASAVDLVNVRQLIDSLDIAPPTDKAPRIIPLKQADADEVLAVVKEVFKDYMLPGTGPPINVPGVRVSSTGRARTAAVSVDVDPRSNSLIVAAPEEILKDIEELVKGLELAAADTQKSYRVLPIQNSSPQDVRNALEVLLDRQLQRGSSGSSSGGSRSTPNRRPRTPRTRSTTSPRTSRSPRTSETVPAKDSTPAKELLAQLKPEATSSKKPSTTQVTTIRPRSTGLEVTGAGAPVAEEPTTVRTVGADEDDLAEGELTNAAAEQPAGGEDAVVGPISGNVEISVLDDVGALLLLGTEKDLQILGEVVAEIEKMTKNRELSFELYPLMHAQAAPLADLLNDLYGRILDARGSGTRAQAQSTVIPLARPNAVLLVAAKDDLAYLADLAKRFDIPASANNQFKIFRLQHIRALTLSQTIETFYASRRQDGELAPEIVIEADDRSNTLIVSGGPADIEEIAELIKELDTSKTSRVNDLRIFYLKYTVATELSATLQATLQSGQLGGQTAGPTTQRSIPGLQIPDPKDPARTIGGGIMEGVTITPNRRANAVIISAPKDVMTLIESLVKQLDVLPEALAQIKVFALVNSDASTLVRTLRALFAQIQSNPNQVAVTTTTDSESSPLVELSFSVDERTNSILASGTREQLEVVEAIVLRLDSSDIEERKTDVYRLENVDARDVAASLTDLLTQQQQISGIQEGQSLQQQLEQEVIIVPEQVSNSLLISASSRFYDRVIDLVKKLDELPPQVVIQVLLVQVELDSNLELGVELGLQDGLLFNRSNRTAGSIINPSSGTTYYTDGAVPGFNFNSGGPLGNNVTAANAANVAGQGLSNFGVGRTSSALGYGGLVLSASSESVNILIRALARDRRLEVLSRPQIMTLDNQTASILVGADVPQIANVTVVQGGGALQSIQYTPTGIILEVTPKINPDGTVIMQVSPEVSALSPVNDTQNSVQISPGVVARAVQITRAVTTVSAQDGQTVIIGGLIQKSCETETRKVPCLGDIPVMGHLFRYDTLVKFRKEFMIILTPHIVRSREDAERIKAVEAARMNWCLTGVEKLHGSLDLPTEVYVGESPDMINGQVDGQETIEEAAPIPPNPMTAPQEELVLPNDSGASVPKNSSGKMPTTVKTTTKVQQKTVPPQAKEDFPKKLPLTHTVSKVPIPQETSASESTDPSPVMKKVNDPVAEREKARKERAERDEKLARSPTERRKDDFNDWKKRNLRWKKDKDAADKGSKPAATLPKSD